jgi:hypothetical protein
MTPLNFCALVASSASTSFLLGVVFAEACFQQIFVKVAVLKRRLWAKLDLLRWYGLPKLGDLALTFTQEPRLFAVALAKALDGRGFVLGGGFVLFLVAKADNGLFFVGFGFRLFGCGSIFLFGLLNLGLWSSTSSISGVSRTSASGSWAA